jgi:adsorption protein B
MTVVWPLLGGVDLAMREAALFAATGFFVLGLSDLCVDLIWITGHRRRREAELSLAQLPSPRSTGMLAVFVPAWDEAAVIGPMLRGALAAWPSGDWRIYVGLYPNDPATRGAVEELCDPRLRVVVGHAPGPTTKADCLNRLWDALLADEAAAACRAKAVILHDAEDVVHPDELRLFDSLSERFDLVQIPVLPILDPRSKWIAGHYADEFAEAHRKELPVRQALGAGLPSAGVGCAFSREALGRLAESSGGYPFDAQSLTEDYELGLRISSAEGSGAFVRVRDSEGAIVSSRGLFPSTMGAAVAQKARWITGIALCGWDRLGWSGGWAERWMRVRDRQSLLAAMLLLCGYLAVVLWLLLKASELGIGYVAAPLPAVLTGLVSVNMALLAWRLALRAGFTASSYGWREGLRAVPRAAVSNLVAMLAAAAALARYRTTRRDAGPPAWGKTEHRFPAEAPVA